MRRAATRRRPASGTREQTGAQPGGEQAGTQPGDAGGGQPGPAGAGQGSGQPGEPAADAQVSSRAQNRAALARVKRAARRLANKPERAALDLAKPAEDGRVGQRQQRANRHAAGRRPTRERSGSRCPGRTGRRNAGRSGRAGRTTGGVGGSGRSSGWRRTRTGPVGKARPPVRVAASAPRRPRAACDFCKRPERRSASR